MILPPLSRTSGFRLFVALGLVGLAVLPASCATYHDDLVHAQRAYEQNGHERALAILRATEGDLGHLTPVERARYAYLRGMTDFRVGYKADAHHWLSLAQAWEAATPNALPKSWKTRLGETITELNEVVFKGGMEALSAEKAQEEAQAEASDDNDTEKHPAATKSKTGGKRASPKPKEPPPETEEE